MDTIVQALFETPNWVFEAYGSTDTTALQHLRKAWKKHAEQTDAEHDYLERNITEVQFTVIDVGLVFRDGQLLYDGGR